MNIFGRIKALGVAAVLAGVSTLPADTFPPVITTAATTTLNTPGRPWVYIALGQNRPDLLASRRFMVSARTNAGGIFRSGRQLTPPVDPTAIGVMLARAASIGDNLAALEAQPFLLHAWLATPPGQPPGTTAPSMTLPQRLSAMVSRAAG